mmetsp:Transcript_38909/g.121236  ORF Transcript_38909/g.121236 Transcript_38909/m.121236 type:complete len:304 (-) Transcript_38909:55-966(-)
MRSVRGFGMRRILARSLSRRRASESKLIAAKRSSTPARSNSSVTVAVAIAGLQHHGHAPAGVPGGEGHAPCNCVELHSVAVKLDPPAANRRCSGCHRSVLQEVPKVSGLKYSLCPAPRRSGERDPASQQVAVTQRRALQRRNGEPPRCEACPGLPAVAREVDCLDASTNEIAEPAPDHSSNTFMSAQVQRYEKLQYLCDRRPAPVALLARRVQRVPELSSAQRLLPPGGGPAGPARPRLWSAQPQPGQGRRGDPGGQPGLNSSQATKEGARAAAAPSPGTGFCGRRCLVAFHQQVEASRSMGA